MRGAFGLCVSAILGWNKIDENHNIVLAIWNTAELVQNNVVIPVSGEVLSLQTTVYLSNTTQNSAFQQNQTDQGTK